MASSIPSQVKALTTGSMQKKTYFRSNMMSLQEERGRYRTVRYEEGRSKKNVAPSWPWVISESEMSEGNGNL